MDIALNIVIDIRGCKIYNVITGESWDMRDNYDFSTQSTEEDNAEKIETVMIKENNCEGYLNDCNEFGCPSKRGSSST